ncbi:MAG: hypothetical protein CW338_04985 [Clostridiales bacterium]|nr:hypothetical protein [Clostridiales bacterium]
MIRQAAFEGMNGNEQKMLKGALHCHTTRSDGKSTPEEVIAQHAAAGYDFLAITDHRNYNYSDFGDHSITIIPGMEQDRNFISEREGDWCSHCFHSVCLGPADQERNGYRQDERPEGGYVKNQAEFQQVLDEVHRRGNITFLCHPRWSCLFPRDFDRLEGIWAMELWNTGCVMDDDIDRDNGDYWDEMLMQGKRWAGVAVDDGHCPDQNCKGWVRVNSGNDTDAILSALQRGAFYSSCGPEIYDFYVDDDRCAHIACSPCVHAQFYTGIQHCIMVRPEAGDTLESARNHVNSHAGYVRCVVTDREGRKAWTNPVFL